MKTGTKSLLFGPKHLIIRTAYIMYVWKVLMGKRIEFKDFLVFLIQNIGLFGKPINKENSRKSTQKALRIMESLEKEERVKFNFGVTLESACQIMRKNPKWEIIEIEEDLDTPRTIITIKRVNKRTKWSKILEGREKEKIYDYSDDDSLYYANKVSLTMMPKWLLAIMTFMSNDPEGRIELKRREECKIPAKI